MTEYKPTGKTYEIDSLKRLLNAVSFENYEKLMIDFGNFVHFYLIAVDDARKNFPEETKDLSNWDVLEAGMEWVDDGQNDLSKATIINQDTGELIKVEVIE